MPGTAVESDETEAIERMLDDGAPVVRPLRARRRRTSRMEAPAESPAEERAAQLGTARRVFRLYCVACGRSTEGPIAPARAGRCPYCGGTMLLELTAD